MHLNIKKLNSRKKKIAVTEFTEVWGHPFSILFFTNKTKQSTKQEKGGANTQLKRRKHTFTY